MKDEQNTHLAQNPHRDPRGPTRLPATRESNIRMQAELLRNAPVIAALHDLNRNIVWANRAYEEATGLSQSEIVGRKCHAVWSLAKPCLGCPVGEAIQSGETREAELTPQNQDCWPESQGYWLARAAPVHDTNGKIIGAIEIAFNIRDRKRAAELVIANKELVFRNEEKEKRAAEQAELLRKLSQSEKRFRALFEANSDGVVVAEVSTKRFLFANKRACKMFGYSLQELCALGVEDIHPKEDMPAVLRKFERQIKGEIVVAEDLPCLRKDKTVFYADFSTGLAELEGKPCIFGMFRDITERRRSVAELNLLRTAIEQTGDTLFITDLKGTLVFVNPAFEISTGYGRAEALGRNPRFLKSGKQDEAFYRKMWETISSGRVWKGRLVNKRKDGALRTEDTIISPVRGSDGRIINYVAVKRDVTEQIQLEEELRQSQKMESVGRLAGGVAHDFNNILTAINGYVGFALEELAEGDLRRDDLNEVLAASARAAGLTRQLLAFSRKQILNPQVLDLNTAVGGMLNMLRRIIGEDLKIEIRLAATPCLVKVDAGQIDQVLLNLAVNARDAMPKGGALTFETTIATPIEGFALKYPDMPRAPFVCLIASDTGCGMTEEVKEHLFEPFYTTKEQGKGTGLGLSTVYGIIKQSGGEIEVDSSPGRGTLFRIYFPQCNEPALNPKQGKTVKKIKNAAAQGGETILLVEDEESIRRLATRILTAGGYSVLTAANGHEALKVIERHGAGVDLLITDVVMPGMSGRELSRELASKKMLGRTLFISGFTDGALENHGVLEPGLAFMYKPFSPAALLCRTREILDGPADQVNP